MRRTSPKQIVEHSRERVGMFFGKTGVPIFLLATTRELSREPILLTDPLQLASVMKQSDHAIDRLFLQAIQAFFASGGRELYVLAVTVSDPQRMPESFMDAILGSEGGFRNKTGLRRLGDYDALADLLLIPQASLLLESDVLGSFLQTVSLEIQGSSLMLLADAPCTDESEKLVHWSSQFDFPHVALFYPWVTIEGYGLVGSSIVMASHLQNLDMRQNLAVSPANLDLPKTVTPVYKPGNREIDRLLRSRLNIVRQLPSGSVVLWGCSTTAKDSSQMAAIQISRTLSALRDAVERTCESFVMEARTAKTCEAIQQALKDLLEYWHQRGLFANRSLDRSFQFTCDLADAEKGRSSWDSTIEIDLQVAIGRTEDFIGLGINV
jgi:hypothetical protein